MNKSIALAGNPNSGKTTLFNRLTGTRQTTGNWPGVTVERKSGQFQSGDQAVDLVDLPGIYSLAANSPDEKIARDYLTGATPDLVINIVDATNLERNLYLTLQLKKLGLPMLVALNMMDEIRGQGLSLDIIRLAAALDLPVIPVSARRGSGLTDLLAAINERLDQPAASLQPSLAGPDPAAGQSGPGLTPVTDLEAENAASEIYRQAAAIHGQVVRTGHASSQTRSDKIDRILTHRILAIPLFLLVIFLVFQVTFHEKLGGRLTILLDSLFSDVLAPAVTSWLQSAMAPAWIHSLLIDGILAGLGGILTFLPQIALLFFFLSVLEDTGYMARAAFIMDRIFQVFGLSGRSFIPMLIGFGCTVPAVMAARTLDNERDRRLTIMIIPFMSCGARMPVYALFAGMFFPAHKGLVTFAIYLAGMIVAALSALLLSRTVLRGQEASFLIELPPYRLPDGRSLLWHVWDKVRDFCVRAGTIIFAMTIVVWFCQNFNFRLQMVADSTGSILGRLGTLLAPLFTPLGFGNWQSAVALLTGLIAKESVVASLGILFPANSLQAAFTPLSALAFMAFVLLYTPCVAAVSAIRREMNSLGWTLAAIAWQTGAAWLLALLVYQAGKLLTGSI